MYLAYCNHLCINLCHYNVHLLLFCFLSTFCTLPYAALYFCTLEIAALTICILKVCTFAPLSLYLSYIHIILHSWVWISIILSRLDCHSLVLPPVAQCCLLPAVAFCCLVFQLSYSYNTLELSNNRHIRSMQAFRPLYGGGPFFLLIIATLCNNNRHTIATQANTSAYPRLHDKMKEVSQSSY